MRNGEMRKAGVSALCGAVALAAALTGTSAADAKSFKVALGDAAGSAQDALGTKFVEELEARTPSAANR